MLPYWLYGFFHFVVTWVFPFYDYVDSIFVVVISLPLYLYYLYTRAHSLCGCCLYGDLSLLHTHTHSMCVVVLSLPFYLYDTNTHTLSMCG